MPAESQDAVVGITFLFRRSRLSTEKVKETEP